MIKKYFQGLKTIKLKYYLLTGLILVILSFLLIKTTATKSTLQFSGIAKKINSKQVNILTSERTDSLVADSIDVENYKDIPKQFLNIPADFEGIKTDNGIRISDVKSRYFKDLNESIKLLPEAKYQKLYSLFNEMENRIKEPEKDAVKTMIEKGIESETKEPNKDAVKTMIEKGDEFIDEIKRDYALASYDENRKLETEQLVKTYRIMMKRQELYEGKAYYINADNYIPEVYQEIYDNSKGSVAIFNDTDDIPLCSGVLIAKDKILTCLHCLNNIAYLTDMVAKFGYEEKSNGSINNLDEYPVTKKIAEGTSYNILNQKLDFVILEVGPNKENKKAGDNWPIQPLAVNRTVQLNDAVYVIGYPKGERKKIHDNSYVFWPFEINATVYSELELKIKGEFEDSKQQKDALREFSSSYKKNILPSGETVYQNYSVKWNNMPTIGVNCSTSHGNSGSPLYLKRKIGVVGILFDGSIDEDISYRPGWKYHEAILPIKEIVRQLDQQGSDWRKWPGIEIK